MPLLRAEGLRKIFHRRDGSKVYAVSDVSLEIPEGKTLALIGESGSGKSTVGRLILRLLESDEGTIEFDGVSIRELDHEQMRRQRADMQVVFQEPYESLNPRMRVAEIVAEPLLIHRPHLSRQERREQMLQTLEEVGLDERLAGRLPRSLSGGQQQRVGVARALATRPKLIVLDEPTSSLDLSVQAQILQLLRDLQSRLNLSYLYISHNVSTVKFISDWLAVMYLGQIRESGPTQSVMSDPQDPYTRALLSAYLDADPRANPPPHRPLKGEIPDPSESPSGCFLYGRCPIHIDQCRHDPTDLRDIAENHHVRCIRVPFGSSDHPLDASGAAGSTEGSGLDKTAPA